MELSGEELRVLGCLIEKSHTTPDQYPLSTNSLRLACNQKTSREPVVDYTAQQVDAIMRDLRDGKWARSIHSKGNRGFKHRHVIDERLGLTNGQQAILAVLMLRGPQSVNELASRTERYNGVADADDAASILSELERQKLAKNVGRGPGQSQDRWVHQLGAARAVDAQTHQEPPPERVASSASAAGVDAVTDHGQAIVDTSANSPAADDPTISELYERVRRLEERVAKLEQGLP